MPSGTISLSRDLEHDLLIGPECQGFRLLVEHDLKKGVEMRHADVSQ
jgi:hypothetical protein